jgi:hypothetical protein
MNRIKLLTAAVCTAAALAVPVSSASAKHSDFTPPDWSGNPGHGATVHHCKAHGGKGVIVFTKKGGTHGNGEGCEQHVGVPFLL